MQYDKNSSASMSLDGFQTAYLKPVEFKEMLFRTFTLRLTPQELGALVDEFRHGDKDEVSRKMTCNLMNL